MLQSVCIKKFQIHFLHINIPIHQIRKYIIKQQDRKYGIRQTARLLILFPALVQAER